ncbi:MAG: hypothetical protein HZC40_06680 [Chloroflexi bacterium]|nr:hypothetical protein [Chloroflexota bacterium]
MTTRRLVWGMTWQGGRWALWTAIIGGVSNFVLGSIVANIWNSYSAQFPPLMPDSSIAFAIIFLFFSTPIFALGIYLSGISTGLLSGLITIKYFYPPVDTLLYKKVILLAGIFFNLIVGLTILTIIFGSALTKEVPVTIIFLVIPSCINAISGLFITLQLGLWYERESAKGISQNVSSN